MMGHWLSREGLLEQAARIHEGGEDLCVATLIEVRGSTPQDLGAKIVIPQTQSSLGTIGGGKFEAAVIVKARELLKMKSSDKPLVFSCNLQRDLGMSCGGEAKVLIEPVFATPAFSIAVFGAGHVGQALIPLLGTLKAKTYWIDDRQDWLDRGPKENSKLVKMKIDSPTELEKTIQGLPPTSFILALTKGHQDDLSVLRIVLKQGGFPFIGVIGSQTKSKSLRHQLLQEEFSSRSVESFFCPVGEDFGTNDPTEIAFSIVAQILKVRDQQNSLI